MFRRNRSPFMFSGILPLLCYAQGLPGGFGAGGEPPVNGGGQAPPAAPASSGGATPPAAAAPPADPAKPNPGQFEPGWLNDRVEQAKRAERTELLKQLGVTDVEAAKAMLEEGKKAKDATKSEVQRLQEQIDALTPTKAQAENYQKQLDTIATTELKKLPPAAQERIKALVGEKPDPIKLLDAIGLANAMTEAPGGTPAGQQGQQAPGQTPGAPGQGTTPPAPPPMAPPANTTGALGGPPSAPRTPTDHFAHWQWLQEKQPMRAAAYYLEHQNEIVAKQQTINAKR